MTPHEVLGEARRLIAEVGWTQLAYARDGHRCGVAFDSSNAVCFCVEGALMRAGFPDVESISAGRKLMQRALAVDTHGAAMTWNDAHGRTKKEVLAAFDKAIELAGATP